MLAVNRFRPRTGAAQDGRPKTDDRGFFSSRSAILYAEPLTRHPVKRDQSSPDGGAKQFQTTLWSVVLVSAESQAPGSKEAFADLCKLYWYPLYAFIRYRGYSPEDAEDLVQGFFLPLLEHKTLRRVDRSKGKFRSLLLASSLKNHLSNEAERAACLKEAGRRRLFISKALKIGTGWNPSMRSPEKIFDARWAMALIDEALN